MGQPVRRWAKYGNRDVLRGMALQTRILRDVQQRRLSTTVLGETADLPFGIAPMGMCNLAWPGADLMLARLAARENVPHGLSTVASTSMERVWEASQGKAWFQLYYSGDGEGTIKLVERAKAVGYRTLVLTVDVPEVGRRPRELKQGFKMPFRMGPAHLHRFRRASTLVADVLWFAARQVSVTSARLIRNAVLSLTGRKAGQEPIGISSTDCVRFGRGRWWLRAFLTHAMPQSCKSAAQMPFRSPAMGGRQIDGGVGPVQALPKVRKAVGPDFPVFFDSGLRSGEDVLKVLALGADYAFLGRPLQFAIAARQERGLTEYWGERESRAFHRNGHDGFNRR